MAESNEKKKVLLHLGPHSTGCTAVANYFRDVARNPNEEKSIGFIEYSDLFDLWCAAGKGEAEILEFELGVLTEKLGAKANSVFVCADSNFSGDLPVPDGANGVYPDLVRKIRRLSRAAKDIEFHFSFFERSEIVWSRKIYLWGLHEEGMSLAQFRSQTNCCQGMLNIIDKLKGKLHDTVTVIPYPESNDFDSVKALIDSVHFLKAECLPPSFRPPRDDDHFVDLEIECVAELVGASQSAIDRLFDNIFFGEEVQPTSPDGTSYSKWPPSWSILEGDTPTGVVGLQRRALSLKRTDNSALLLPHLSCDLNELRESINDPGPMRPIKNRTTLLGQKAILENSLRGFPNLIVVLALTVCYLERDTPHTSHARALFHRIVNEQYPLAVACLPTSWYLRVFKAFANHGCNPDQRVAGAGAHFFGSMIKLTETERSLEGLDPKSTFALTKPAGPSGFKGLGLFKVGETDLAVNTNAFLFDLAARDLASGRFIFEFLERLRAADTVFSRLDRARVAHAVTNDQFSNCWSFFQEPFEVDSEIVER